MKLYYNLILNPDFVMRRIGGRLGSSTFGSRGADSEIPPLQNLDSNSDVTSENSVWQVVYLGRMPPKK